MLKIGIRFRGNDKYEGKPMLEQLLALLKNNKIYGATVYRGIYGYGARGIASMKILGLSLDLPLLLEVIDEHSKLEEIIPDIKRIVDDNGIVTLEDVYVV